MEKVVSIIGAGLAGCECAWILANNNIKVKLYEMKPENKSEAHTSNDFAELVCSNSLKSESLTNACGLLKKEMEILDSLFIEAAYKAKIPAGQALAVDRDIFSKYITEKIKSNSNIEIINKEVCNVDDIDGIKVIATGPLTTNKLMENLKKKIGDDSLYFFDAAAPIIDADSIDYTKAYFMDRYGTVGQGDYLNLSMNKEEYLNFYNELINAKSATRHSFDKFGGSLGNSGCVSYLFNRKGIVEVERTDKIDSDEFMLEVLDMGAVDINEYDDTFEVITQANEHNKLADQLKNAGYNVLNSETTLVPDSYINLENDKLEKFIKMIDALEDLDDVQQVYHNVNIDEE